MAPCWHLLFPHRLQNSAFGGISSVGGTVCRVVESRHPDYQEGDWVLSGNGWQDYALSDGQGLIKLAPDMAHPSHALGVLGMPGFTAYMGLLDIGQPKAGETLVVAAATGPVGATVGQIGKLKGCRVVGPERKSLQRQGRGYAGLQTPLEHTKNSLHPVWLAGEIAVNGKHMKGN